MCWVSMDCSSQGNAGRGSSLFFGRRTDGKGADDEGEDGEVRAPAQGGDEEVGQEGHEEELGCEDEDDLFLVGVGGRGGKGRVSIHTVGAWIDQIRCSHVKGTD